MTGSYFFGERNILLRVDAGESAAEDSDCAAVRCDGCLMGRRIDSSCEPAVDREAGIGKLVAKLFSRLSGVVAGLAGAHDPDAVPMITLLDRSLNVEHDRRIMDLAKQGGILCVGTSNHPCAGFFHKAQLGVEIGMIMPPGDE